MFKQSIGDYVQSIQIKILRSFGAMYKYIAMNQSLGLQNITSEKLKMGLALFIRLPLLLLEEIKNKRENRLLLPKVCIYPTSRCTLRCRKCAALVPYFTGGGGSTEPEVMRADILALVNSVDEIGAVGIGGGEPFLYKGLKDLIQVMLDCGKIDNITIVTNGTILPKQEVLAVLRNPKVRVQISAYPKELVKNKDKLVVLLKENNITINCLDIQPWKDVGDWTFIDDGKSAKRFAACSFSLTPNIYDGKLSPCSVASMATAANIIPTEELDFINLRCGDREIIREGVKRLLKAKNCLACSYCYGNTQSAKTIPPAEQI
ncbi:MAG: hypothetical protein Pg6A_17400 [Termitinemataceae bacterium]|nr:MAG: hypothetical protein Pg6A_17400 [Termitinemataceae bacterium]